MNHLIIPAAIVVLVPAAAVLGTALVVTRGGDGAPAAAAAEPRVWIDHPLDGARYEVGETVPLRWHASRAGGVARVELRANDETIAEEQDLGEEAIVSRRTTWTPGAAGEYTVEVIAHAADGARGSASVVLIIGDEADATPGPAPETPSASVTAPAPSPEPSRPLATGTPPRVPTPTATSPLPPSPTRPAPSPTAVPATPVPPTSTPSATPAPPSPTATPDTQGPPAPVQTEPSNGAELACPPDDVILRWTPPSDPSGIQSHTVQVETKVTATTWAEFKTYVVLGASKNMTADAACGVIYRWRVRAWDGALNAGSWSGWREFGIELP